MTWMKWLPWRLAIRYAANKHGFLDPVAVLARLERFAQPSEVGQPIELLRAGVVFHARGLINSRVIQHNLDWVWPYWVERQFDPLDVSFVPRAFSVTHINLTHRNWTAVGYPDVSELPIVDPRGLLTPLLDGWSLDAWVLAGDGRSLLPSRTAQCQQFQTLTDNLTITTVTENDGLMLRTRASVELADGEPVCRLSIQASGDAAGWLVLALRPQNPEGVSFIHQVQLAADRLSWRVDDQQDVQFSDAPARHHVSDYGHGDVHIHLTDRDDQSSGTCDVGMVTAAALFPLTAEETRTITVTVPLPETPLRYLIPDAWLETLSGSARLQCPDERIQSLYEAAVTSLVLHSPEDVYPGPYTYKRFWFRDATFLVHALLAAGLTARAERALMQFLPRQLGSGYFRSQEGEWDSNGQVLWVVQQYYLITGKPIPKRWLTAIRKGADWIVKKRLGGDPSAPHTGLLPAGFSAEHLGPNDYYYWDDCWGIAGLKAAADLLEASDPDASRRFADQAVDFAQAIDRSLNHCVTRLGRPAMPASPYRRLDAGAIGSLALGYPTRLCQPDDARLMDTVNYLLSDCFVHGAFYQDMIHSGLNAYLTLQVAQVLLRAGDDRYFELLQTVAGLATATGHWPEAIHPATGGGCMGDGHHVWASAEWVLLIRQLFVREEGHSLVLCSGIPPDWLDQAGSIQFGPAPTTFGLVSLRIWVHHEGTGHRIEWHATWHGAAPELIIHLPGYAPVVVDKDAHYAVFPSGNRRS